jgi:pimeloyl-ACP methyl ester carboxylesterase
MQAIDLPAGRIEYRVTGPADTPQPPVVFVHGLLVNGQLWDPVADLLAERGVRSYQPTLPLGSHRIAMTPDADLTPRGIARIVIDFLEALDLRDVTLVGNDTGGALCQFLIDTDHSRVGRLVLTNCDAFDKFPPAPFNLLVKAARHPALLRAAMTSVKPTALRHSVLGFGPLVTKPLDPDLTRGWITPVLTDADVRRDTAKLARGIDPKDLLDVSTRLDQFDKPVTLVWGTADRFFKIGFAERLAQTFPNAQLVRIEGGRTFVPLDEPEQVADQFKPA